MSNNDYLSICKHVDYSNDYNTKFATHPLMKDFASDGMVSFLYGSNALEGTLPVKQEGDTFALVWDCFKEDGLFDVSDDRKWNTDGRFSNQEKAQIFRHFNAKQSLNTETSLTLDNVKRDHSILMSNSVDKCNKPIPNSKFRTGASYSAGTWNPYILPRCIERGLQHILNNFNKNASMCSSATEKLEVATQLFYDFVSLHPLEDGNRRVDRILLSYGLERMGTSFPVHLTTRHSRARDHVVKALRLKNRYHNNNGLFGIVASSLADQWQSFFNYIKFFHEEMETEV